MMPSLHINLKKYRHNLLVLYNQLTSEGITVMAVTKVFCGDQRLVDVLNETEIEYLADSKIENLKQIKTNKPRVLLRIPQQSEVDDVVSYCDISLNSELDTVILLNESSMKKHLKHHIILMFDLGDLREGIYYREDYIAIVREILKLEHIELYGIGTNLTCYGGLIPSEVVYQRLEQIKDNIEKTFNIEIPMISGGNSSSLQLAFDHQLPKYINNLRIGEAFVLGRETAYGMQINSLYDDVFELHAEIIEIKDKPSMPEGELGFDAFGNKVAFIDEGIMKRAIIGIGRQEVHCENLIAPQGIRILGCSSDHLIVQIQEGDYNLGDTIKFKMTYAGILSLSTSRYLRREYDGDL
ncbi:MAG: alanine/ornithine racemase family PLP-dependent enzyme [Acholeplasmataceae bacterium]|nr:alanine/ornithine racemase family PLP-dependent enzyme [Acholeplasmataceae bacterium]